MAKASGYIIAKQFQKQNDNFEVSMDISPNTKMLVFGYGPMIKFVQIETSKGYWFNDKRSLGKLPIFCKSQNQKVYLPNNQRIVRDLKWNTSDLGKNLIGVAMGQSAFVFDTEDNNQSISEGFMKVYETDDVMRQGDYPSKFIWYPNSKDIFLCTSNKSDEIIARDLRVSNPVAKFNDKSQMKPDQKIQDLKFSPVNPNIFATIQKNSTIDIFDYRKPNNSIIKIESVLQNYKSNLLDWQWNGNRLVSAFGGIVKLWDFNGEALVQKFSFQHKNAISYFKWLRMHPQYLLISQMQQNIIYGYKIDKGKHDIEILVDPRHSGVKKFIIDHNEKLIFGLTNFEDSKKHNHEMMAVEIDYKNKSIWSKTKFTKPNNFGLNNQLLFSVTKYKEKLTLDRSYALIFQQFQSSARKIEQQANNTNQTNSLQHQNQLKQYLKTKQSHQKIKTQRRKLKKLIKQRQYLERNKLPQFQKQKQESKSFIESQSKASGNGYLKKSSSIQMSSKKSSSKNARSLQKISVEKKTNRSFSQSSQQDIQKKLVKDQWILSYEQQVKYLDKHYIIQINDQIPSQKGQAICRHNSKIASRIGKTRCAEFWKYVYYLAFPDDKQYYTLSQLYEDKVKVDINFKDNKVYANCQSKSQIHKKTIKYSLEKLIQNLVDQNQLQTAVMACIMIRNKDEKLLSLQFIQPFFVCYKELLKSMGLTFISTNLSFIAKLNQAVSSAMFSFEIPIGCGQCYRKFSDGKCKCLQVCIICGQSLISSLVIGCKICGHMAHARQYQQIIKFGTNKCPFKQCMHQCFKKV